MCTLDFALNFKLSTTLSAFAKATAGHSTNVVMLMKFKNGLENGNKSFWDLDFHFLVFGLLARFQILPAFLPAGRVWEGMRAIYIIWQFGI